VYVRDDSIDIDEGYNGTFDTALVIQAESIGNHCIEADGLGSYDTLLPAEVENKINQNVNSNVAIRNLTCIVSPSALQGVFDPGAGWRLREGLFGVFSDSMVVSSWGVDSADSNYCLRLDNRSATAAVAGDIVFDNTVFSCEQKDNGGAVGAGTAYQWAEANGDNFFVDVAPGVLKNPTASTDTDLILLEGVPPLYSVPVAQVVVNDVTPDFTATPPGVARGYIGGISLTDVDWIQGWTYGILDGSRAQPLWFE
jgi:hypothetical protein